VSPNKVDAPHKVIFPDTNIIEVSNANIYLTKIPFDLYSQIRYPMQLYTHIKILLIYIVQLGIICLNIPTLGSF